MATQRENKGFSVPNFFITQIISLKPVFRSDATHYPLFSAILPAAGLFLASMNYPQIASASISCQARTVSNYANGSLVTCILETDTVAAVENNSFHCKQGQYIAFDGYGQ